METEEYITQWFELGDGEFFCIQNVDHEDSEYPDDQILMPREMALELAHDIIRMLGDG